MPWQERLAVAVLSINAAVLIGYFYHAISTIQVLP